MPSTYTRIFTNTVTGSNTNTVSFTGIPSSYTDLVVAIRVRMYTDTYGLWRINNDSTSTYSRVYYLASGSGPGSSGATASMNQFYFNAESNSSNWCVNYIQIPNYAATTGVKQIFQHDGQGRTTSILTNEKWNSAATIDRLDFLTIGGANNIIVGSTFTIYGIKKA